MTALLEAALDYARLGWPIFPLDPRAKTPATRHGFKDAPRFTPEVVEAWWNVYPDSNIGLATGATATVVDIDGPTGEKWLSQALPNYQHAGPITNTGRGRHLYFAPSALRSTANPATKIDVRGQGGYVVLPPSVHPGGHRYAWFRWPDPLHLPTMPAMLWASLFQPDLTTGRPQNRRDDGLRVRSVFEARWPGRRWYRTTVGWKTVCPMGTHGDSDPSFTVYESDQHYHCFGCGAHGWAWELERA
jgi:hypothetical protein